MTTVVEVQLVEGLGLPYVPGAEAGLLDALFRLVVAVRPLHDLADLAENRPVAALDVLAGGDAGNAGCAQRSCAGDQPELCRIGFRDLGSRPSAGYEW